jgi:hypothetical protein
LWLLDLDDHLGGGEHVVGVGEDFGARSSIVVVSDRGALARARLDEHAMPRRGELTRTFGCRRDAVLMVLDLGRDAHVHVEGPLSAASLKPIVAAAGERATERATDRPAADRHTVPAPR